MNQLHLLSVQDRPFLNYFIDELCQADFICIVSIYSENAPNIAHYSTVDELKLVK